MMVQFRNLGIIGLNGNETVIAITLIAAHFSREKKQTNKKKP